MNNNNNITLQSKNYIENYYLIGKPGYIINLYNELKKQILSIGDDITINPVKSYIAYVVLNNNSKITFVNVFVRKSKIRLDFCFSKYIYDNFKRNYQNWDTIICWNDTKNYCGMDLKKSDELDKIMPLIKECYEINKRYLKNSSIGYRK